MIRRSPPTQSGLVGRFAGAEVVVVGSTMVDQITYCRRVPEEGETLHAHHHVQGFGGKGANQAVMTARLGANVKFIGCVGGDPVGAAAVDNLASCGVDTSGMVVIDGVPTGIAPIWVDDSGANRILIAAGANEELDADRVLAALAAHDRPPDIVLGQLETPQAATAAAFEWARDAGAVTVLNTAPAATIDARLMRAADWLLPNEPEFLAIFGVAADRTTVADAAARGGYGLVVTLGAAGAIVCDGASTSAVAAPAVDAVDTTGAGDAFAGAFSVGLAAGLSAADAVRLGCAAGALSVGAPGTQTSFPHLDAVLDVFDQGVAGPAQLLPEPTTTTTKRGPP